MQEEATKDLQPHQQRVVDEKIELDEKREKLGIFLYTDIYAGLPDEERGDLHAQYTVMGHYSGILISRIGRF